MKIGGRKKERKGDFNRRRRRNFYRIEILAKGVFDNDSRDVFFFHATPAVAVTAAAAALKLPTNEQTTKKESYKAVKGFSANDRFPETQTAVKTSSTVI